MVTLKIHPHDEKASLETKPRIWQTEYSFKPGLNLLYGGNGAGKTSILELFRVGLRERDRYGAPLRIGVDYDVLGDDGKRVKHQVASYRMSENNAVRNSSPSDFFSFTRHIQGLWLSEGMAVSVSAFDFAYALSHCFGGKEDDPIIAIVDEIDSGLDPVACRLVMQKLAEGVAKMPNLVLIMSFNQYEIARSAKDLGMADHMVSAYTGESVEIPGTYEAYVDMLCADKESHRRRGDEGAWGAPENEWRSPEGYEDEDEEEDEEEEE